MLGTEDTKMGKKLEALQGKKKELNKNYKFNIIAVVIKILTMQTILILTALKFIKALPVVIRFCSPEAHCLKHGTLIL